jgi:hypothetical protein
MEDSEVSNLGKANLYIGYHIDLLSIRMYFWKFSTNYSISKFPLASFDFLTSKVPTSLLLKSFARFF